MHARLLLAPLILFTASALAAAPRDDEKDPVKEKLFAAKVAYDKEMREYRKLAGEWFDRREEVARKDGNKKVVDQLKVEREAFDGSGELPKAAPMAMRQKPAAAKKALEAAYTQAVKEYTKAKKDAEAAAVEEAWKEFTAKAPAAPPEGVAVVITSVLSGKVFGLQNGATEDGTKVVTADLAKGEQTHLWKLVPADDGWVYLENVKCGSVIAVNGAGNGTEAKLARKKDGDDRQLWKLTPVAGQKGVVKLVNKGSERVLGVDANLKTAGARIILWDDNGKPGETYTISPPK